MNDRLGEVEYVVRCYVCGHRIGTTDDPDEITDVCEHCARKGK